MGRYQKSCKKHQQNLDCITVFNCIHTVPTNVSEGTKTSSFFPTLIMFKIECKAAVPLIVEITYLRNLLFEKVFFQKYLNICLRLKQMKI